jgi:four helix bundle protein
MTNDQAPKTNNPASGGARGSKASCKFDLTERTARFGEATIVFARKVKLDTVTTTLVRQLVRAATSVGANYCEADEAGSRKEFRYRISVSNREIRETKHWLRMIAVAAPSHKEEARRLWKEAHELNLIFSAIYHRSNPRNHSGD